MIVGVGGWQTLHREQLGDLGMVLGSSVNRTLSAWNSSHLGWFLNPTRQNSCSMANTDLEYKKKIFHVKQSLSSASELQNSWSGRKNNLRYLPCKPSKQLSIRSFPAVWAEWVGFFNPKGCRRLLWESRKRLWILRVGPRLGDKQGAAVGSVLRSCFVTRWT